MIAIDFGLKRIGVAHYSGGIILPLAPIMRKNRTQAARDLDALLCAKSAKTLIIGVANDEMRRRIGHFTALLNFAGEIILIDETLSSQEAESLIAGRKQSAKFRKDGTLDSLAAMIILERFIKNGAK